MLRTLANIEISVTDLDIRAFANIWPINNDASYVREGCLLMKLFGVLDNKPMN